MIINYVAHSPVKHGNKETIQLELVTDTPQSCPVSVEWSRQTGADWSDPVATVHGKLENAGWMTATRIANWLPRFATKNKFEISNPDALIVNLDRRGGKHMVRDSKGLLVPASDLKSDTPRYTVPDLEDSEGNRVVVKAAGHDEAVQFMAKTLLSLQMEGKISVTQLTDFLQEKRVEKVTVANQKEIPDLAVYVKRNGERAKAPLPSKTMKILAKQKA